VDIASKRLFEHTLGSDILHGAEGKDIHMLVSYRVDDDDLPLLYDVVDDTIVCLSIA